MHSRFSGCGATPGASRAAAKHPPHTAPPACAPGSRRGVLLLRGGSSRPPQTTIAMTAAPSVSSPALPSASVEVFSASGCRYCAIAKAKLKELCVPFTEIDVTVHGDDEASAHGRKSLAERVGRTSVPQIFVAGEHVGGCDELLAAVADGSFAARLSAAGISTETPAPAGADAGAGAAGEGLDIELAPKGGVLNYHKSPERGEHGGAAGQVALKKLLDVWLERKSRARTSRPMAQSSMMHDA
jgi:glutaredoxin 3